MISLELSLLIHAILDSMEIAHDRLPQIVGIDGFYGSGKTCFANSLDLAIKSRGQACLVLGTDDFMRYSRRARHHTEERYLDHRNWYDIDRIGSVLKTLRTTPDTMMLLGNVYNHSTGELDRILNISVKSLDYVILEGMYALHENLLHHIDMGIFLIADHEVLLRRVIHRDTTERGLNEQEVRDRYWVINGPVYQHHVLVSSPKAHLVLETSSDTVLVLHQCQELGKEVIGKYLG